MARYGGPERLQASLDLFTLSSVHVLRLVQAHEGSPSGWVRPAFLRSALHLAWGLAGGQEGDLAPLAGYADRLWPDHFEASRAQGDAVFAKRGPELMDMARRELARAHEGTEGGIEGGSLAAGGCRLSSGLSGLHPDARWHVAASHVHMTANRIGLTNAEEVYLSRLLARAVGSVRHETPEAWKRVWELRAVPAPRPLEGLVTEALEGIAA